MFDIKQAFRDIVNKFATLQSAINGKADSGHTHDYAASSHTHKYAGSSSAGGAANNSLKLQGMDISADGNRYGVIPFVGADGGLEIGKYIDFHSSDTTTQDHEGGRVKIDGNSLKWNENILHAMPTGSVVITSTNSNPSSYLGGTWELFDKEFKSQYLGSITSAFTPTNCTVSLCHATLSGHAIQLRMQIKPTAALADSTVVLGNFAVDKLGTTSLGMGLRHYPLFSDDGNAVVIGYIDGTELSSRDVVVKSSGTSVASGNLLTINVIWNLQWDWLLDSYCDKFYWKRTA